MSVMTPGDSGGNGSGQGSGQKAHPQPVHTADAAAKPDTNLMDLIHQAGFRGQAANIAYAIVMAESGGDATAHNTNAGTGDNSYGLAQINMIGSLGPERLQEYHLSSYNDLFNPETNLRVMYQMSNGGASWTPWSTYKSGAYLSYLGQSGGHISNAGAAAHGGGDGGGTGGGAASGDSSIAAQSGFELSMLQAVPQLRAIVQQAETGGWSVDRFTNAIENSPWYKSHSDTARQTIALQLSDPATYQQNLNQTVQSIQAQAAQEGWELTPQQAQAIAHTALLTGNSSNSQWILQQVGRRQDYTDLKNPDNLQGGMAATVSQLQQLAGEYGWVYHDPTRVANDAKQILMGNQTIDTYTDQFKNYAKSAFPGLAKQIDSGQTVMDVAQPYISSMSNLLEVDPSQLNVQTPLIRKALQGTQGVSQDKSSVPTVMPVWQFEDRVRQDPRWGHTDNAKADAATMLVNLGQAWGFAQ